MDHIEGLLTKLIEVAEIDAPAICRLRNNPANNKFLSSSDIITIEEQVAWIRSNKSQNDGVYFKIIEKKTNEIIGTISLYNVSKSECEFGRYICEKTIQAIEAEYLILKFGFEIMNLKRIFCRTAEKNHLVWRQHIKFGFRNIGTELLIEKDMLLMVQEIKKNDFDNFNYSPILTLLQKFVNR